MSNNLDVRIAPNGHPYVCLSQVPPLQTLPHLPQISHPLTTPQVAISPLSQLAQLPQHINMPNAPFDQVLNSSVFSLPPPPVGVSVPNPFLEALTAHFMSLQPTFNAIFPFGANSLSVIGAHKTPVPLMSLRISTPPAQRAHPYQMTKDRSDQDLKRPRQRNNSVRSISQTESYNLQVVENRTTPFHHTTDQPGKRFESPGQRESYRAKR